jgi:hypothetical protein
MIGQYLHIQRPSAEKRLDLKSLLRDDRRLRKCVHCIPSSSAFDHPLALRLFSSIRFSGKTHAKQQSQESTMGGRTLSLKKIRFFENLALIPIK